MATHPHESLPARPSKKQPESLYLLQTSSKPLFHLIMICVLLAGQVRYSKGGICVLGLVCSLFACILSQELDHQRNPPSGCSNEADKNLFQAGTRQECGSEAGKILLQDSNDLLQRRNKSVALETARVLGM